MNRDFRDLLAEFNAHGVECLVVGLIFQIGLPPVRIDVLTAIDGVDFAEAWPARLLTKFADQSVAVLSRKHLIQNKRASGRMQDLADVEWLETRGSKRRLRGRRPTSR